MGSKKPTKQPNKLVSTENKVVVARRGGLGMDQNRYRLALTRQVSHRDAKDSMGTQLILLA